MDMQSNLEVNMCNSDYIMIDYFKKTFIQMGFIIFFASVFPLAPIFACIAGALEYQLRISQIFSKYRKPVARQASDIGVWEQFIYFIVMFAIPINLIIILFLGKDPPEYEYLRLKFPGEE